ncbi:uncharacterized protein L969DRAFT_97095 [Mixia osmundae IAM 14324]|uniref:Response regulatory domain-containing protein n=1 Tax=Mixia osmundae (strain CBS 9802 / IAM 14324 / JCM 22182 / KY 12970) TaxID=764103 RepID=G7E1N6_MIXOS|nr:uncharacterized protein L969DRAFT_97095 [Mixia osmundae IAM 14324]KEI36696.1 hypothetical protein L969DRAFT_97095 [Mixia osmundae IAM 14324]GAA96746.1 hypothetical protein E5Q_03417 [Mixia osmundae IAM 14324]
MASEAADEAADRLADLDVSDRSIDRHAAAGPSRTVERARFNELAGHEGSSATIGSRLGRFIATLTSSSGVERPGIARSRSSPVLAGSPAQSSPASSPSAASGQSSNLKPPAFPAVTSKQSVSSASSAVTAMPLDLKGKAPVKPEPQKRRSSNNSSFTGTSYSETSDRGIKNIIQSSAKQMFRRRTSAANSSTASPPSTPAEGSYLRQASSSTTPSASSMPSPVSPGSRYRQRSRQSSTQGSPDPSRTVDSVAPVMEHCSSSQTVSSRSQEANAIHRMLQPAGTSSSETQALTSPSQLYADHMLTPTHRNGLSSINSPAHEPDTPHPQWSAQTMADVFRDMAKLLLDPMQTTLQQVTPVSFLTTSTPALYSVVTSPTSYFSPQPASSDYTQFLDPTGARAPASLHSELDQEDDASLISAASGSAYTAQSSVDRARSFVSLTTPRSIVGSSSRVPVTTNEQLASSALTLPAVSVAAIWRGLQYFTWLTNNMTALAAFAQSTSATGPLDSEEVVFDLAALLQSTMDILASLASQKSVELNIVTGVSRLEPGQTHSSGESARGEGYDGDLEVEQVLVRGDEMGIGLLLISLMRTAILSSFPGDALEMSLRTRTLSDFPSQNKTVAGIARDRVPQGSVICTLEYRHARHEPIDSPAAAPCPLKQPLVQALSHELGFVLTRDPPNPRKQTFAMAIVLPSENDRSRAERHRASDVAAEPSIAELLHFADTSLKGKKVSLCADQASLFAKHLTGYLAGWGMDVGHMPFESESEPAVPAHSPKAAKTRLDMVRQNGGDPSSKTSPPDPTLPALDPTINFIVIDDDIATLKRQLVVIRNNAPQLHLQNSLLAKRPQLHTRRTRSSAQVRQAQVPPPASPAVIHFASLANYRKIRTIVRSVFKGASSFAPLPEVLVVPKPIGPRRLLASFYTALRRPTLDPFFAPIATSPSSGSGHMVYSPPVRPSPGLSFASSSDHDSPMAAQTAASVASHVSGQSSSHDIPQTPPEHPQASVGTPEQSPLSADALEYFSETATRIGSSGRTGVIIQSPDGRPSALFFQPSLGPESMRQRLDEASSGKSGSPSSASLELDRSSDVLSVRSPSEPLMPGSPSSPGSMQSLTRSPTVASMAVPTGPGPATTTIVAPHSLGLGYLGRRPSVGTKTKTIDSSTHAQSLDSYVLTKDSSSLGAPTTETRIGAADKTLPAVVPQLSRLASSPAMFSNHLANDAAPSAAEASAQHEPQSAPIDAASELRRFSMSFRGTTASPMLPAVQTMPIAEEIDQLPSDDPQTRVKAPTRRTSSKAEIKAARRIARRPTMPIVPPVNVLIVEDNPINQTILCTHMKRKGIKYSVANNGQEAVDKWKQGGFHLVLMDIQLPVKSGIEATREIREMERQLNVVTPGDTPGEERPASKSVTPKSPLSPIQQPVIIVALTASSLQTDRIAALTAGCNDFLTKPVSLPWLQKKLLEWGSMQILSGFSRRMSPEPLKTPGLGFGTLDFSAQTTAVAERLHIGKKPLISGATSGEAPFETETSVMNTT